MKVPLVDTFFYKIKNILVSQTLAWVITAIWLLLPLLYLHLPFYYQPHIPPVPEVVPRWVFPEQPETPICVQDESRPRNFIRNCITMQDERPPITALISKLRAELVIRRVIEQYEGVSYISDGSSRLRGTGPSLVELTLPNSQHRRTWMRTLLVERIGYIGGRVTAIYVDVETDEPLVLIPSYQMILDTAFEYNVTESGVQCIDPIEGLKKLYTLQLFGPAILSSYGIWALFGIVWGFFRLRSKKTLAWLHVVIIGAVFVFATLKVANLFLPYYSNSFLTYALFFGSVC